MSTKQGPEYRPPVRRRKSKAPTALNPNIFASFPTVFQALETFQTPPRDVEGASSPCPPGMFVALGGPNRD